MESGSGLLAGQRALITGGAAGLGAAMVRRFADEGATGVVLDLEGSTLTMPSGWEFISVDVRDENSVAAAIAAACATGPIDALVANAGVVPAWTSLQEQSTSAWDEVFAINVRGVMFTLKHASEHLSSPGAVIVTASLNSFRGDPNIASYVASKHAVLGVVRSAALEWGPRNIRVNAIGPGPIATDALRGRIASRNPGRDVDDVLGELAGTTALRRLATEEDVANTAVFLASSLAAGITGQILAVDGGIS
jgi:3alpha(or 20beta)-hydroxysteroid dehydrogenase